MSKRWSLEAWRPRRGKFVLIQLSADWCEAMIFEDAYSPSGWFCVTSELLGFGVSLTYWRRPDVYGDGGVA